MHEIGIARDLWAVIKQNAKRNSIDRIKKVTVVVGESSGIDPELLRHSLVDHIFPGSIADKAKLEILGEKVKAKCSDCGEEITNEKLSSLNCHKCGGINLEITSGRECYVKSIEG